MMDTNTESITSFTETAQQEPHDSNGIQTPNTVVEELDEMDLLVYSDSDDDMRTTSKPSMGRITKPMEMINDGKKNVCRDCDLQCLIGSF